MTISIHFHKKKPSPLMGCVVGVAILLSSGWLVEAQTQDVRKDTKQSWSRRRPEPAPAAAPRMPEPPKPVAVPVPKLPHPRPRPWPEVRFQGKEQEKFPQYSDVPVLRPWEPSSRHPDVPSWVYDPRLSGEAKERLIRLFIERAREYRAFRSEAPYLGIDHETRAANAERLKETRWKIDHIDRKIDQILRPYPKPVVIEAAPPRGTGRTAAGLLEDWKRPKLLQPGCLPFCGSGPTGSNGSQPSKLGHDRGGITAPIVIEQKDFRSK